MTSARSQSQSYNCKRRCVHPLPPSIPPPHAPGGMGVGCAGHAIQGGRRASALAMTSRRFALALANGTLATRTSRRRRLVPSIRIRSRQLCKIRRGMRSPGARACRQPRSCRMPNVTCPRRPWYVRGRMPRSPLSKLHCAPSMPS